MRRSFEKCQHHWTRQSGVPRAAKTVRTVTLSAPRHGHNSHSRYVAKTCSLAKTTSFLLRNHHHLPQDLKTIRHTQFTTIRRTNGWLIHDCHALTRSNLQYTISCEALTSAQERSDNRYAISPGRR
ncbi:hypothetical protein J6590_028671 [Homalodisca vitripennis]|nr:hypothetical protein J6590_028671 [Homalodisca vitripennis]